MPKPNTHKTPQADIFDHLSRTIEIEGRKVYVFDGLFPEATRKALYEFVKSQSYRWINSDDEKSLWSIRWKLDLPKSACAVPFFSEIVEMVSKVFPNQPNDLIRTYINFSLYGEIHNKHKDTKKSSGLTAIFYANIEWDEDWQGELFFYEKGEPCYAIAPKPGRLVIFDGKLEHRGSAPSRASFEPRLNIAFKFGNAEDYTSKPDLKDGARNKQRPWLKVVRK